MELFPECRLDLSNVVSTHTLFGTLLEGIFVRTPTVSEVAVYLLYLIPALVCFALPPGSKRQHRGPRNSGAMINIVTTYFSKGMAMIIQFRRTALQLTVAAVQFHAHAQAADIPQVKVTVNDKQCEPMNVTVKAGKTQFIIQNHRKRWSGEILKG